MCYLLFEATNDKASGFIDEEEREGKDDADGRTGDDACGCWVASVDQYVCKHCIEDRSPKAASERLHHVEAERGGR